MRPRPNARFYLYAEPVDMRKSINGLAALIEEQTERTPFDTALYVFCNRRRDKIKLPRSMEKHSTSYWMVLIFVRNILSQR